MEYKKTRNPVHSFTFKVKEEHQHFEKNDKHYTKEHKATAVEQLKALNINSKGKSPSRSTSFMYPNKEYC